MRRLIFTIVGAIAIFSLLIVFIFADRDPARWIHGATGLRLPSSSPPDTQVYDCQDPYRRPGFLHVDPEDYKQTRWIPYTDDFLDAPPPASAKYPPPDDADVVFDNNEIEAEFLDSTKVPPTWMDEAIAEHHRRDRQMGITRDAQKATDFVDLRDDGGLGWLWGRRILIFGDSVDRFMIQFFCEEFGRTFRQHGQHMTATCSIPTMNLTLVHWHHAGSWTYRPDWWWMDRMDLVAFEERWDQIWEPTLATSALGDRGRPDLVLWQSGLWDQRALWEAGEAHFDNSTVYGQRERQLFWGEVRFIAARIQKLVERMADEFGTDVPIMFRSLTIHRDSNAIDANLYELDRISRAIAERNGHEIFEWGRIITALSMLYKDKTHPAKGPISWLWGNMILEYAARAAGRGDAKRSPYFKNWEACHQELVNWGGR